MDNKNAGDGNTMLEKAGHATSSLSASIEKMTDFSSNKIKDMAHKAEENLHHIYQNLDSRAHEKK